MACLLGLSVSGFGLPLGSAARTVIPSDAQQIISVDYRTLHNSDTAQALRQQVLPQNLKDFESALQAIGINPDKDVDQLTFASFRNPKLGTQVLGIAQGTFPVKAFLKKMQVQKTKPSKIHNQSIWPMSGGMSMAFLDDSTLLFGYRSALEAGLDARDGYQPALATNNQMSDMMGSVENGTVWSILDQQGTQNMMRSALGDAAKVADYETVKKRLLGSRYTMNFTNGVNFDLDVVTSDSFTAGTLASLVKAGMLYKKINATPSEKIALDSVTVDSNSSNVQLHFKTDDKRFESLLHSDLFAKVSR
jgi:hypothetical protein